MLLVAAATADFDTILPAPRAWFEHGSRDNAGIVHSRCSAGCSIIYLVTLLLMLPQEIIEKVAGFASLPRCVSKRIEKYRVKVRLQATIPGILTACDAKCGISEVHSRFFFLAICWLPTK